MMDDPPAERAHRVAGYVTALHTLGDDTTLEAVLDAACRLVPEEKQQASRDEVTHDLNWAEALGLLVLRDGSYQPSGL